jgi:Subtilase family/Secretion system C-terminal sorting domain
MIRNSFLFLIAVLLLSASAVAEPTQLAANVEDLEAFAAEYSAKWESWRGPEFLAAQQMTTGIFGEINADPNRVLVGVDQDGNPIVATYRNVNAAISTRANLVQVGGVTGYDLDGSTSSGLYHWDGSSANGNHQEFVGRITNGDGSSTNDSHANHTAGTMMASGVNASAKGMATGAHLTSHNWNNDQAEMAIAATQGMKVSSHSYGFGDSYSGAYDEWARGYDTIMHDAPHYQAIIAAGNLGSGSFFTLYDDVCGKNSLAVGNVNDVLNYNGPGSVNIAGSSSVGPPDDGRVKPDIMGNGQGLYSCTSSNYTSMSGTSMASPNIAGSMFLMYELYEQTHNGDVPLSSTMRAVLFNTADECGSNDGPDYKYGWGLMNTRAACDLIAEDEVMNPNAIAEYTLSNGATDEYTFSSDGVEPITVTVVWTDPEAAMWANPTIINDLDVEVEELATGTTYYPWKLNFNSPSAAATTGDNDVDTVEQIWIENPVAGAYVVRVFHEGTLVGDQDYSLVVRNLTGGEAPQFLMNMTPIFNYIGPNGGTLTYNISFRHTQNETIPGMNYWNMVILPNGNPYGPVFQANFTITPFMDAEYNLGVQVPASAPGGTYEFIGNVGTYPNNILISDSFEMVKFGGAADNQVLSEFELESWEGTGFGEIATDETEIVTRSVPSDFQLGEAYPNPFNPTTSISVSLPESAELTVQVYNLSGRLVATLSEGHMDAGSHSLTFDGSNLASGVYFVHAIVPGELNATRKLVLMK